VIGSLEHLMFKLHRSPPTGVLRLIFVVNIKFPRGTYHTIVPSTEEFYCLISGGACDAISDFKDRIVNERTSVASFSLRAHLIVKPLGAVKRFSQFCYQFEAI